VTVNHQHLRAFHAIAAEGSISRAARRLNVAQPTLSQQLKALEGRHRVVLFEDRRSPLRLTAAGRELFTLTQRLFGVASTIDDFLQDDAAGERAATARLGSDSPIYAARLVKRLRARFTDLTVQVRIGNARETLKALAEAQVDAAVVSDPPGDNNYSYEPLFADRLVVAAPLDHPHAKSRHFPLEALAQARLLVREPTSRTRLAVQRMLDHADIAPAEVIELHTRETIREGVALGLGVALFISSECPPDPRIAYVPLDPMAAAPELCGYIVCLKEQRRTPLMRAVMEIAADLRRFSPVPLQPPREAPPARPDRSSAAQAQA
jgi:DNA-binding transcriptional LysR family regulator